MEGDLLRIPVPIRREHHPCRPWQPAHTLCPPDARGADSTPTTTQEQTFSLVYCEADIPTTCEDWTTNHFLSLLLGTKLTAPGRLEYLHFIGTDTASCAATYTDGSTGTFTPVVIGGNSSGRQDPCLLYHHGRQSPPAVRYRLPHARLRPRAALHQLVWLR